MTITIVATGSRGDVQPFVALGRGLRAAGYEVRLATHREFGPLVQDGGLELRPVAGDISRILGSPEGQALMEHGRTAGGHARSIRRLIEPVWRQIAVDVWEASQGADLLLSGGYGSLAAVSTAEKLGVPLIQVQLQPSPMTPTRAFPCVLMPPPRVPLGGWFNYLSHVLTAELFIQAFLPVVSRARRDLLGLPPARRWPWARGKDRSLAVLYGFSPQVVPKPREWGANVHVTGYWFLDRPADWQPPADLVAFLRSGPPPIYVGFGSMSSRDSVGTAERVVEALALAGQRGVILRGSDDVLPGGQPDTVFVSGPVPHDWLFPQMAAVVHHGGAGTTGAGLRAGVPSLVVPVFADQPFWGARVRALGVGPVPVPHHHLRADRLAQAITLMVSDPDMRRRAAELGERIRSEDGVASAVELVEAYRNCSASQAR